MSATAYGFLIRSSILVSMISSRTHLRTAAIALVIIVGMAWLYASVRALPHRSLVIGGQTMTVAIASTQEQRERGLGGQATIGSHEGMLFVFQSDVRSRFWMKDMYFPIDIIWIARDGTILYIVPDARPDSYPQTYGPDEPARYVLEVPADFCVTYRVRVGDTVQLPRL